MEYLEEGKCCWICDKVHAKDEDIKICALESIALSLKSIDESLEIIRQRT